MKKILILAVLISLLRLNSYADLQGWWQFDDGTGSSTSADSSGFGRTGTLTNMDPTTDWVTGKYGDALDFDGSNDHVFVTGYQGVTGSTSRSILAWVKIPVGATGADAIASWGNSGNVTGTQWTFLINNGKLEMRTWGDSWPVGTASVNDGQWHHIASVWENTGSSNLNTLKYYVDGDVDPSGTANVSINTEAEVEVTIGCAINPGSATVKRWFFKGKMDDVRIFDKALSEVEIEYIMSGIYPFASSPNPGEDETVSGESVTLKWKSGDLAGEHDVYVGDDFTAVLNADIFSDEYMDRVDVNFYDISVVPNQDYFWRIDEINDTNTWEGPVWAFSTASMTAYHPTPNVNTIEIDVNSVLSWKAGASATSHNIYFGKTNPPSFIKNQPGLSYDPGPMDPNTTYYWQIDETNGVDTWPGDLWSFTTGAVGVENIEFPDGKFANVRDFGAYGDGIHDDTAALEAIINGNDRTYLPNGTYLVSDTISWPRRKMVQGQNQQGTIIKLKDNESKFQTGSRAVLQCYWNNNQTFANYIQNMTINTGIGNPAAIGVRYNTHNNGAMRSVTIKTEDPAYVGKIGLDLTQTEFGPGLIKDVTVIGFDTGIKTPGNVSHATMEFITVMNQNNYGMENYLPTSLRGFKSINTVPAIKNGPGGLSHLVLLEAQMDGGSAGNSAIVNNGNLYLRDIEASGYQSALQDGAVTVPGLTIDEYIKGNQYELFASPDEHLNLPVLDPAPVYYEPVENWVYAPSTGSSDYWALQLTLDSGAETIYLDDGTYEIDQTLKVRGNVKRIVGYGATIKGPYATFGDDTPIVKFEGTGAEPITVEFVSFQTDQRGKGLIFEMATSQDVYFKSCKGWGGNYARNAVGGTGNIFGEDMLGIRWILNEPQNLFIRQWNVENSPLGTPNDVSYGVSYGGNSWILGMKTEAMATHFETYDRGHTEILGGFFRDHSTSTTIPYWRTEDASISATYYTYQWTYGYTRALHSVETRDGTTLELNLPLATRAISLYKGYKLRGDLDDSNSVDFLDYAKFGAKWLADDCNSINDYCDGANLNNMGLVDEADLDIFRKYWLREL